MAFIDTHETIYKVLLDKFQSNQNFAFRARKTNRNNKLSDGYWFLGNENYLAIGFWEGLNWMTKTSNISFYVNFEGVSWLGINTNDDNAKTIFVENYLLKELNLIGSNGEYHKVYSMYDSKKYLDCLIEFLEKDWKIIDTAVREANNNLLDLEQPINIIKREDCEKNISKIEYYRSARNTYEINLKNIRPSKIKTLEIKNYGPITKCDLKNIPKNTQWIFLTGENGVGKTSILKALASAIGNRKLSEKEFVENKDFTVFLSLTGNSKKEKTFDFLRIKNNETNKTKPNTVGFAAYGPMRLQSIYGGLSANQLETAKSKSGSFNSLFNNDGFLLDLESEFIYWKENDIDFSKRKEEIKELLENAMINIGNIEFSSDFNDIPITLFQEIDKEGKLLPPVGIDKLSSGYLSIVAMMSDMLIRLYKQQPLVNDIADLEGIVLIDEIDIHLHPKFQKHFVEQLTEAFPKVQFIATTHSPIPLLGAPKNTVICVIKRDYENGVTINRVDDKIYFQDLLPNTILTSPIFNMGDITNDNREEGKMVRTEKTFEEIKFVDKLESKIKEFITDEKEKQLIELFEARRK